MNGYSKIRAGERRSKSISVDFSDLALSPPPKIPQPQITTSSNKIGESFPDQKQPREPAEERGKVEEDEVGERFGAILSRSCSISSATSASQRFDGGKTAEKNRQQQSSYGVLKRAFSLRRSSSVSEGYCRIHDQWGPLSPPPPCDGEEVDMQTRSAKMMMKKKKKKKKRRSRFIKACKRLFGFS